MPRLQAFLRARDATVTITGMLTLLEGPNRKNLILELHTIAAFGRLIGDICYELEGDGPLIFKTYELYCRAVNILSSTARLPQQLIDYLMTISSTDGIVDPVVYLENETFCRNIVTPAREYLAQQAVKPVVAKSIHLAKVATMWNPLKVYGMTLDDAMLTVRLPSSFFLLLFFIFCPIGAFEA